MSEIFSFFTEVVYPRLRTARILFNNSTGTAPLTNPLFTVKVGSVRAVIYYPLKVQLHTQLIDQSTAPPVTIGSVQEQQKTLSPGEAFETYVPDLSTIYVTVPAGAKIYLEVVWEE